MYTVVLMAALSVSADVPGWGRHYGGCYYGYPSGFDSTSYYGNYGFCYGNYGGYYYVPSYYSMGCCGGPVVNGARDGSNGTKDGGKTNDGSNGTKDGGKTNGGTSEGWNAKDVADLRDMAATVKLPEADLDRYIEEAKAAGADAKDLTELLQVGKEEKSSVESIKKSLDNFIKKLKEAGGDSNPPDEESRRYRRDGGFNDGRYGARVPAEVIVHLPAQAKLWIHGKRITSEGETRVIRSPGLARGRDYYYILKAEVEGDNGAVTAIKRVVVRAGETTEVTFDRSLVQRTWGKAKQNMLAEAKRRMLLTQAKQRALAEVKATMLTEAKGGTVAHR